MGLIFSAPPYHYRRALNILCKYAQCGFIAKRKVVPVPLHPARQTGRFDRSKQKHKP